MVKFLLVGTTTMVLQPMIIINGVTIPAQAMEALLVLVLIIPNVSDLTHTAIVITLIF